jgi:hypothetical protein
MRLCKTCNSHKCTSEFYKNKSSKDGLSLHCRDCSNSKQKLWSEKYKNKNKHEFIRNCPTCDETIHYTQKSRRNNAEKTKSLCWSCASKKRGIPESFLKNHIKGCFSGEKNPFYGKKHTEETRKKIRENGNTEHTKTKEFREKISKATKGNKNPMFGKSVYSVWIKKYGSEKADQLMADLRQKQSANSSGKNNNMYGRPSPKGSGNGWSGWYGDFYFRSLKELSYAVELDNQKIQWVSAEKIKIGYKNYDGADRTYCPDFLVENCLIEIKPKRLWESMSVKIKQKFAIDYCEKNNLSYKLIDPPMLSMEIIKELRDLGKIKFIDRYEEKFKQRYESIQVTPSFI